MNIFFELHSELLREGPGSNSATSKALSMLSELPEVMRIVDIGCGPGMQTMELAKKIKGSILALDFHEPFLEQLVETAKSNGVAEVITVSKGDMFNLNLSEDAYDLIWSEGAIYIIGFERGINEWKKHLKTGSYLVASELSWLKLDVSEEAKTFWEDGYPSMKTISQNIAAIEDAGYTPIGHFILEEAGWWEHYYTPLEKRVKMVREKYSDDIDAQNLLDMTEKEIQMYRDHSSEYGYVFYLMQK